MGQPKSPAQAIFLSHECQAALGFMQPIKTRGHLISRRVKTRLTDLSFDLSIGRGFFTLKHPYGRSLFAAPIDSSHLLLEDFSSLQETLRLQIILLCPQHPTFGCKGL